MVIEMNYSKIFCFGRQRQLLQNAVTPEYRYRKLAGTCFNQDYSHSLVPEGVGTNLNYRKSL